ncbi:MAG: branched-chain amino acid ABC transporter permease [Anaerolineae bacterium]|nr:branched-chain amino acid ABC transporter permease [Anaerolineae bacterium]MDW8069682.1 branched-chain amino acid ABC transporter permease [Anaerolineae bacterium]
MPTTMVAQSLASGILVGALYGLAAVGLSLVFGVTKILNVSHGELLMLGGYTSFWLFTLFGVDPFAGIPLSMFALVIIGLIVYQLLFSRLIKLPTEDKIRTSLLVGFGLGLMLQNIALRLWTADNRGITPSYAGAVLTVLGVRLPYVRVASLVIAFVFLLALQLFLQKTYTGKAIRATAQDWEAATLMGINVHRVYLLSFVLGTALAGAAGTLVAVGYSVEPVMGLHWTLKALIVLVMGGIGSIAGTLIGGLILGVTESAAAVWISGNYRHVVGLAIFILVLLIRPQGLFGAKEG